MPVYEEISSAIVALDFYWQIFVFGTTCTDASF